ncbi:cytochrome c oxidase subunit II [Nitratireductor sp. GCM10026969]|uniref:cytochrome c oxidase subunit II n=1 Tax=Nitratireductor sp. GCM10026969 TaxID=3252645 RepID=UPI00361EC55B
MKAGKQPVILFPEEDEVSAPMIPPAAFTRHLAGLAPAALFLFAGCTGPQSALQPSGAAAREVAYLWWAMFWAGTAIFVLVLALLLYPVFRQRARRWRIPPLQMIVAGGIALPVVALSILLVFGLRAGSGVSADLPEDAISIRVTAHQWWWDIEYVDRRDQSRNFTTANELYLPVGQPVELLLTSSDVIHSLWLPRIAGKIDLIPTHTNRLVVEAEETGVFRGQCAEFCGLSHAQMAFYAVAVPQEEFEAWVERQRAPAAPPSTAAIRAGKEAFDASGCVVCHTVRGGGAWGVEGPDLTHLGSRLTIAAGTFDNTRENIAAWIARNEQMKPGNKMPEFPHLDRETRLSIAAYLESLQ